MKQSDLVIKSGGGLFVQQNKCFKVISPIKHP